MPIVEIISGVLTNLATNKLEAFIDEKIPRGNKFKLWLASLKKGEMRVSVAYLYKIYVDGHYLLIKGNRIDQYQPVGGARKYYPGAGPTFRKLLVRPDDNITIDNKSIDDLRIRIPNQNIIKFLDWYETKHDREVCQQREFREELVIPGYLDKNLFVTVNTSYLYTVPTYHYSQHFRCWELLYHEVYEPIFSTEQLAALRALKDSEHNELKWVKEDLIMSLGHDRQLGKKPFQIGEHARLLINSNIKLFKN